MLEIKNLEVIFNQNTNNQKTALDQLSLKLDEGDFVTVIGSNGAGKSTLLNCIAGAIESNNGSIHLNQQDITYQKEHQRAKIIGRLFQDPLKGTAPSMTILENLELAYRRGGKKLNIIQQLFSFGLHQEEKKFTKLVAQFELGLENSMKNKVGLLSGGQRQALTLLMATINPPKLLLLDEHTAALDPKTANKVMQLTNNTILENKTTTIMITHNIEQALKYGNRMIVMSQGKIVMEFDQDEKNKMSVEDVIKIYSNQLSDRVLLSN